LNIVEQSHQVGFREEGRTRGLRDHAAKASAHSAWEEITLNPAVKKRQDELQRTASRKRKMMKFHPEPMKAEA
jgi:hypothetical protein